MMEAAGEPVIGALGSTRRIMKPYRTENRIKGIEFGMAAVFAEGKSRTVRISDLLEWGR